jgi:signal transduction histidine kinase
LQSLIEQFYELSMIEDFYTAFELEPIDAVAVLTDCLLGNYPLFEEKGIEPKANIAEKAVMILSNTHATERIFQNLIHNALKFANESIEISLTEKGIFSISNDTANLTDADISYIFDRFYTVDKSRSAGNTGLGLYIVKRLLENTGGGIENVSLENGKFTITVFFREAV